MARDTRGKSSGRRRGSPRLPKSVKLLRAYRSEQKTLSAARNSVKEIRQELRHATKDRDDAEEELTSIVNKILKQSVLVVSCDTDIKTVADIKKQHQSDWDVKLKLQPHPSFSGGKKGLEKVARKAGLKWINGGRN